MKQYIIKACGNIDDVINQIELLQSIFGKGATLSDIAKIQKYATLLQEERATKEKLKHVLKGW